MMQTVFVRTLSSFAAALMMPREIIREAETLKNGARPRTLSDAMNVAKGLKDECGFTNVSLSAFTLPSDLRRLATLTLNYGRDF